jgi:hypothetical protein
MRLGVPMAELICIRQPGGALHPATDEDSEALQKIKAGAAVRVEVKQIRNYKFHRKWFALAKYAFDIWEETMPPMEYKGQPVMPEFDRFRRDLTILCGYFDAVYNVRGEVRVEAKSISFVGMDEATFEKLYSKTIDVILAKILGGTGMTEDQLRGHVDNVLRYS